jgi:hypothetical protein
MREGEFDLLIAMGERQAVEFKSPAALGDQPSQARIARAIIALTNSEDGGWLVIGVRENSAGLAVVEGLTDEQLQSWQKRDHVLEQLGAYAVPWVNFDVDFEPASRRCVVIRVHAFADIPVVCSKMFEDPQNKRLILRRGGLYARSLRGRPSSVEASEPDLMRVVLQVAISKGNRRFVEESTKAGTIPSTLAASTPPIPNPYAAQKKDFLP